MSPSSRRLFIRVLPDSWVRSIRARRAHRRPVSPRPSPPSSKTPEFDETSPQSTVLTRVAAGERLDDAVVHQVRALLSTGDAALARTVGESLLRRPGTFELGSLLLAITAFDGGYRELAWKHFAQVNRDAWSRWAVREFVLAGTSVASATVIEQLRALVDETAADVTPEGWGDAAGHAFGIKEGELASALFARFDAAVDAADPSDLDPRVKQSRDWIRPWVAASADSRSAPEVPTGHVSFAIMDYGHPAGPARRRTSATTCRASRRSDTGPPPGLASTARRTWSTSSRCRAGCGRRARTGLAPTSTHHRRPRRLDVHARSRRTPGRWPSAGSCTRSSTALRLPVPSQPAADLRLLPLQQARPAHARGEGVPPRSAPRSAAATGRPSTSCSRSACPRSSPAA